MSWRIHLTNQAIRHLDILTETEPVLLVWIRPNHVHAYDLEKGTLRRDLILDIPAETALRQSEEWLTFIRSLRLNPKGKFFPRVRMDKGEIFLTEDGKFRLLHLDDDRLIGNYDRKEGLAKAHLAYESLGAVALDYIMGTFVAVDEKGRLHVFQQNMPAKAFDIGLELDPILSPHVAISHASGMIFVSDGKSILRVDTAGQVLAKRSLHYSLGRIACSPKGDLLITSDLESGVIRAYHSEVLQLTYQKFAIDLVAEAAQIQLMADLPPVTTAITALAAADAGYFSFAMAGIVCSSQLRLMDLLPGQKDIFES